MLVLSRKKGQVIEIGDDISITIVDLDRARVKIGIVAPARVKVLRKELLDRPLPTKEHANGTLKQSPRNEDRPA